jgi:hypothetical protein
LGLEPAGDDHLPNFLFLFSQGRDNPYFLSLNKIIIMSFQKLIKLILLGLAATESSVLSLFTYDAQPTQSLVASDPFTLLMKLIKNRAIINKEVTNF